MTTKKLTKIDKALLYGVKLFKKNFKDAAYKVLLTDVIEAQGFEKLKITKQYVNDDDFKNYQLGIHSSLRDPGISIITQKDTTNGLIRISWVNFINGKTTTLTVCSVAIISFIKKQQKINFKQLTSNLDKLTPGTYEVYVENSPGSPIMAKKFNPPNKETLHQEFENVSSDLEFFFNNIERFKRNDAPGIRRILLAGEPGTGKTTGAIKLTRKYRKHIILVITSLGALGKVFESKFNHPVILITEDLESLGNHSELLNILDGNLTQKSKHGTYVIFTSNRPKMIDPRIIKRPGRIDKVYLIDKLNKEYSDKVANLYFEKEFTTKGMFENMTGAQIKELSIVFDQYIIQNNLEFDDKHIPVLIEEMRQNFQNLDDMGTANSEPLTLKRMTAGFMPQALQAYTNNY